MKLILAFFILFNSFSFSQTGKVEKTLPNLKDLSINDSFVIKPIRFNSTNNHFFYVYSTNLNLNISYYSHEKETKNFSFQKQNTSSFNKKDSFNPNGANNIGTALVFGALNLLIDKN